MIWSKKKFCALVDDPIAVVKIFSYFFIHLFFIFLFFILLKLG